MLEDRKKLLRVYTQNIDGIEHQVGVSRVVSCHGSFSTSACLACKKKYEAEELRSEVMNQCVPKCPCGGTIKPCITFFGEPLPAEVGRRLKVDRKKADLLLVLGTSLKVAPISKILQCLPHQIPQVLINMEMVRAPKGIHEGFDLNLLGTCDEVVSYICTSLGWAIPGLKAEHQVLKPRMVRGRGGQGRILEFQSCTWGGDNGAKSKEVEQEESEEESESEWEEIEVVTCDDCQKTISGPIHSCKGGCPQYDLCDRCYSRGKAIWRLSPQTQLHPLTPCINPQNALGGETLRPMPPPADPGAQFFENRWWLLHGADLNHEVYEVYSSVVV
ncbi:unnamed protein product [Chrysoparadoxa australica]